MRDRALVQTLTLIVGVAFLVVGLLGFVPGVTTHYGDLAFAGHGSGAKLFGVFRVSVLHDLVHVAFGVVGIALAKAPDSSRLYLVGGGSVYLALWVLGVADGATWIPANGADNWLHFVFGVGMIGLGYAASPKPRPAPRSA